MPATRFSTTVLVGVIPVLAAFTLAGCSKSSPTAPTVPAAAIQAAGEGALVLHPSVDLRYVVALETPLRIRETGGGTATWNFARMSFKKGGVEIERSEMGASALSASGFARVAANSSELRKLVFRLNSPDFDAVTITLGFGDNKDGRQFSVDVPFVFSDVTISLTPLNVPVNRVE